MVRVQSHIVGLLTVWMFMIGCTSDNQHQKDQDMVQHSSEKDHSSATKDMISTNSHQDTGMDTSNERDSDVETDIEADISMSLIDMSQDMEIDTDNESCQPSFGTTLPITERDTVIVMVKLIELKDGEESIIGNGGARTSINESFSVAYQKDFQDFVLTFDSALSIKVDATGIVRLVGKIARREGSGEVVNHDIDKCIQEFGEIGTFDFIAGGSHAMRVVFTINKSNS